MHARCALQARWANKGHVAAACADGRPLFGMPCGHKFCKECWALHLDEEIGEHKVFCVTETKCPDADCGAVVDETIWRQLATAQTLRQYEQFVVKHFITLRHDMAWCPSESCNLAVRYAGASADVHCQCGTSFCFTCRNEAHSPLSCALFKRWREDRTRITDQASFQFLMKNFRRCPKCHVYIERNQGCNHMTCRVNYGGCGHQFCYKYGAAASYGRVRARG